METPSSTRRVTRSQTLSASNNNKTMSKKIEDSGKGVSKSRQDRSALIDITNDSPIVGLAMGKLETPILAMSKKSQAKNTKTSSTPGSGEALLRGQVKTLLQKVEEEAELSKLSFEERPFSHLLSFVNSPMGLLAPTPANTPQILSLSDHEGFKNSCLASVTPSPVQEQLTISQMVTEIIGGIKQGGSESEKILITRSLLLDFSEKSEISDSSECSSVLTHMEGVSESKEKPSMEEDNCSVWSVQVNASTLDDEEEIDDDDEVEEEEGNGLCEEIYELCEEMSKISVNGGTKYSGKHTRFVYNSDDELEGVESEESSSSSSLSGIIRLKGLPTPKGKHLRFPVEEEEDN
ncbi:Portal protein [Actinidia chinensis var. chinensis]|uniref:Portal protein n=1 Tax=Actinidia chinensis var. chinensis TaxID=1590841 RepID=A0A2R6Q257_ACTCC|nr:Portal protein [Actinidia chinensis var. chinensis]